MQAALILAALVGTAMFAVGVVVFARAGHDPIARPAFVAALVGAALLVLTGIVALVTAVVPA